jgi:DNA-binding XRE family transcriptional regulator
MTKERRQNNSIRKMATDARLRQMLRSVPSDHAGFTQDEIAQKVGVAKQTISKIERGAMLKITEQIAKYLTD